MIYHAPTDSFIVKQEQMKHAATYFRSALIRVREMAGKPLHPYKSPVGPLMQDDFAQIFICEAALKLGIDLGISECAHNYHKIDLSEL